MSQFTRFGQAAVDYNSTIIGALELSEKKWVLAVQLPGFDRHSRHMLDACGAGLVSFVERKAIALDPNFAPAYAVRGWLKFQQIWKFGLDFATQEKEFEKDIRLALALDPTNVDAHAGLIQYLADMGQWTETSAELDRALQDHPRNIEILLQAAAQLPCLGRPEEGVAMADLALRLDPRIPRGRLAYFAWSYFMGRKFERAIEVIDQIPEEIKSPFTRFYRAASYAFLGRAEEGQRAKADLVAKNGEQVMEIWTNEGWVFARTNEQDFLRETFRKLGFRICATDEELKKIDDPKRLPECVKS
jgi:tetratricopeptide (TPR) repeat protein